MDFTSITVEILKGLGHIVGNYGVAIILLTILVRVAMWPLSVSQQKSMKKMQELSPKLKEIQTRYKSDPQVMQKKMMEFYKEHKFNPFGGCFPLLLQMPIFILLYAALSSPQFSEIAGTSSFLFINKLDNTIKSHAGAPGDHVFGVEQNDAFSANKIIKVYSNKGIIKNVEINDPGKALSKQEKTIIPGKPIDFKINIDSLNLPFNELSQVKKADITLINTNTKEIEHITFDRKDSLLTAQVNTEKVNTVFHYDVFLLVVLFGLTMFLSQKVMTAGNASSNTATDDPQKAMQEQMAKIMPIMVTSTFIFVPIPAGVLLYMVVSNIIQVLQTVLINKSIDKEAAKLKPATQSVPLQARPVKNKKDIDKDKV